MTTLVARAIIPQGDKVLLVKNQGNDYWCLPGGRVEEGEPITQALVRELYEELGVHPEIGQLLYVQQLQRASESQRVEFFFLAHNPEASQIIQLAQTAHDKAELAEVGFYRLDEVRVLPGFLAKELPDVLKNYTPSALPHFRTNL
jgi:ADP-ribose pyrophosphatase YjhB (NUDIX family)